MNKLIQSSKLHWSSHSLTSWLISQEIPKFEFTDFHNEMYKKLFINNFIEEVEIPKVIYINCPIIYANLVLDNNWKIIN